MPLFTGREDMVYGCVGTLSLQCSHKFVCGEHHQEKLSLQQKRVKFTLVVHGASYFGNGMSC